MHPLGVRSLSHRPFIRVAAAVLALLLSWPSGLMRAESRVAGAGACGAHSHAAGSGHRADHAAGPQVEQAEHQVCPHCEECAAVAPCAAIGDLVAGTAADGGVDPIAWWRPGRALTAPRLTPRPPPSPPPRA